LKHSGENQSPISSLKLVGQLTYPLTRFPHRLSVGPEAIGEAAIAPAPYVEACGSTVKPGFYPFAAPTIFVSLFYVSQ
jgi:hypothetical protein